VGAGRETSPRLGEQLDHASTSCSAGTFLKVHEPLLGNSDAARIATRRSSPR